MALSTKADAQRKIDVMQAQLNVERYNLQVMEKEEEITLIQAKIENEKKKLKELRGDE